MSMEHMTVEQWMKLKNIANYGPHLEPIIRITWEAAVGYTMYEAARDRLQEDPEFMLRAFLEDFHAWSLHTFGPGQRTVAVLKHIRKELDEIAANPDDVMEWIDVALLSFNGAMRRGCTAEILCKAFEYKLAELRGRTWPPPGADDEVMEHIRAIPALGNMHPADAQDLRDVRKDGHSALVMRGGTLTTVDPHPPAPTTPLQAAAVFGHTLYAQGRCDFVDSLFGQCVLGAGHHGVHVMKEDQTTCPVCGEDGPFLPQGYCTKGHQQQ